MVESFTHEGITIHDHHFNYLLYADDLVIFSNDPHELQSALNNLSIYCKKNKLSLNTQKTKCLPFYKGGHKPTIIFEYDNIKLENTNTFEYLGVTMTTQSKSSKHIDKIITKCNSRVGQLFSKIPLPEVSLQIAMSVFNCYILPVLTYAIPVWLPETALTQENKLNSLQTKFLKRWLGVPYCTDNSVVYKLCNYTPLFNQLQIISKNRFLNLSFPNSLNRFKLDPPAYSHSTTIASLPDYFTSSPVDLKGPLPHNTFARRALLYDALDLLHSHLCETKKFHKHVDEDCLCKYCHQPADDHHRHSCSSLKDLTSSAVYKLLMNPPS